MHQKEGKNQSAGTRHIKRGTYEKRNQQIFIRNSCNSYHRSFTCRLRFQPAPAPSTPALATITSARIPAFINYSAVLQVHLATPAQATVNGAVTVLPYVMQDVTVAGQTVVLSQNNISVGAQDFSLRVNFANAGLKVAPTQATISGQYQEFEAQGVAHAYRAGIVRNSKDSAE